MKNETKQKIIKRYPYAYKIGRYSFMFDPFTNEIKFCVTELISHAWIDTNGEHHVYWKLCK